MRQFVIVEREPAAQIRLRDTDLPLVYRGMDRAPWACVDQLFYDGSLLPELAQARKQSFLSAPGSFSPGALSSLDAVKALLRVCGPDASRHEIIGIELMQSVESGVERLMGLDCYVDGYGSPVKLGVFTSPESFPSSQGLLNRFGLFDTLGDLRAYLTEYSAVTDLANLEPLDFTMGTSLFRVFGGATES